MWDKDHPDSNGYIPSIMPTRDDQCYVCHFGGALVRHEIYHGKNRTNSKAHGLWVWVCPACHNKIHNDPATKFDDYLKRNGQWMFERNHTRAEFMDIFGRNYL